MGLEWKSVVAIAGLAACGAASADAAEPGEVFRDCDDCPEMVIVPGASFQMGTESPRSGRGSVPVHEVAVPAFAVGRTEVTHAQYAVFAEETGRGAAGSCLTDADRNGRWETVFDKSWRNPGFAVTDAHPVTCMNWADATAYADWLSQKTGERYRLPSEAEYEYAMRGGTITEYWWGDDEDAMCLYANGPDEPVMKLFPTWTGGAACDDGNLFLAPVASYRPNGYGLYDMTGNAWEWTADCYVPGYEVQPRDGSAYVSEQCARHTTRGGSWGYAIYDLRSGARNWKIATYLRGADVGFRVARDL